MKTLSDCISALSRVKHLLTDPDAGPCVDECAATIEHVLRHLDGLECERKIAAMEEPISLVLESNDAYERFGIRIANGVDSAKDKAVDFAGHLGDEYLRRLCATVGIPATPAKQ